MLVWRQHSWSGHGSLLLLLDGCLESCPRFVCEVKMQNDGPYSKVLMFTWCGQVACSHTWEGINVCGLH